MKILKIICLIQTLIILALGTWFIRNIQSSNSIDSSSTANYPKNTLPSTVETLEPVDQMSLVANEFSEEVLRKIVSEELDKKLDSIQFWTESNGSERRSKARPAPSSQAEIQNIEAEIDYYISIGTLSEVEMGNLQEKIVKLDEKSKKQMFKKLFRALNDGLIDTRL